MCGPTEVIRVSLIEALVESSMALTTSVGDTLATMRVSCPDAMRRASDALLQTIAVPSPVTVNGPPSRRTRSSAPIDDASHQQLSNSELRERAHAHERVKAFARSLLRLPSHTNGSCVCLVGTNKLSLPNVCYTSHKSVVGRLEHCQLLPALQTAAVDEHILSSLVLPGSAASYRSQASQRMRGKAF